MYMSPAQHLPAPSHHYPSFSVTLYPFICEIISGEITLYWHSVMVWQPVEELHNLDWAEADGLVIEEFREQFDSAYA